jgi:hypothetical protein
MAYFMADYGGKLGLVLQLGHQAPRDEDAAPGEGDGVNLGRIRNPEFKRKLRGMGNFGQALPDGSNIRLHFRGPVIATPFLAYLGVGFRPHIVGCFIAYYAEFPPAGRGVCRACRQKKHRYNERKPLNKISCLHAAYYAKNHAKRDDKTVKDGRGAFTALTTRMVFILLPF